MSQLLAGAGSAFSSLGSQVAAQASVPHQDLGLVVSLLLLWSSIGASVGDAVAGQYWGANMPVNLRKYLPPSVNDTEIEGFYADITTIKEYDFGSVVREGATRAYECVTFSPDPLCKLELTSAILPHARRVTVFPLWSAALGLSFVCLIAACFQVSSRAAPPLPSPQPLTPPARRPQSNYFLGESQNAYDHKDTSGRVVVDDKNEHVERKTLKQKVLGFWDF